MALVVLLCVLAVAYGRTAARLSPGVAIYLGLGFAAFAVIVGHAGTQEILLAAVYGGLLLTAHRGRATETVTRAVAIGLAATALAVAAPDLALRASLASGLAPTALAHGFALICALLTAGLGPLDARDWSLAGFAAVGAAALPAELFAVAAPWGALGALVFVGGRSVVRSAA